MSELNQADILATAERKIALAQVIPANSIGGLEGVTRADADEAFKLVADRSNWKNPIDRMVYLTDEQVELVREAVIFFTGSVPKIERVYNMKFLHNANKYHVTADGYYRAVGA
jgi:hypothetical protein